MADGVVDCNFPVSALLPKKETGVTTFITKYPEYDGRGTTIAIFDSGVDPGAPGLQVTSDGKPKVIERFDCSGAGDVDTSTVVELEEQGGELQGLTGRKLKVPSSWSNPSRKWHLGVKNAADLYPNKVKERINSQLKEKLWDPQHKESLASATRELQDFEAKYSKATTTTTILSPSDKLIKDDLECRVEALNAMEKKYTDFSSFYDCVLFHDGEKWKACIDTSENGDLAAGVILSEYGVTREFATLTEVDQLSVSINVHDNGNILEIVGICTSHGTHVASIASAYFPDDPDRCGIAPGAQIVSLTIGDGRLGSMETGTALVRAMIKVMEMQDTHPIHVINMSYGEHAHFSNHGRIGELMNEVVNKYGVVWVASAGNHGPALCTVGTPPDISQPSLIGVAAYVSPEMMVAEYSLRQKLPGMPYTWSSRGPTIDGDIGVTVCAPGGAITSVPSFTLSQAELMNGTSMAAPHVAGAIGVLVSGLLEKGLKYSPYSIKRALENSSTYIQNTDKFSQGSGLLNVSAAFEHLTAYNDVQERDMRFNISCSPTNSKGVHIRCGLQDKPKDFVITVEPHFKDHRNTEASKKINFGVKLCLTCDASWVNCGKYLNLCNSPRAFSVRVDGSALTEGVHSTSIKAYDVSCIEKGPLFQVHFTLVQPTQVPVNQPKVELSWTGQVFQANTIQRHFILVPELSTWAVLRLKSPTTTSKVSHRFVIHCMQLRPLQSCKDLEFNRLTNVSSLTDTVVSFPVKSQLILEVAIAKYWTNPDDITLDYSIEFRGICPDNSTFTMYGGDGLYPIQFRSLRNEEVMPAVTLKYTVQTFRPTEAKVSPLTIRDVIPPSRQIYELVLSYSFNVPKPTEVSPNMALLSDLLYESEFESQLWMLYDSNKQLISCGDAYPDKYVVKVDKGEFILKLSIRHEKRDLLEKLVDSPILISQKLPSVIALDVFTSQTQAILSGKKVAGGCLLPQGHCKPFFIAPLNNDRAIKSVTVGQYLSGVITFTKDDVTKKSNSYIFKYMLPDAPKKNGTKTEKDKDKTKWEECCESIRDIKTSWLAKLEPGDDANNLYTELIGAYPEHFSIHLAMVQSLDPNEPKKMLPSLVTMKQESTDETQLLAIKILEITDVVIKGIDQDKLLSYIGLKSDTRPDAAKIKVVMDRQKAWLVEALCRRGIALCRLHLVQPEEKHEVQPEGKHQLQPEGNGDQNSTRMEQITEVWRDILKYVDQFDSKVLYFSMWHAAVNKHYGRLVKLIFKAADDKPIREFDEKLAEIYAKLEWKHAAAFIARSLPKKYPHAYCPF